MVKMNAKVNKKVVTQVLTSVQMRKRNKTRNKRRGTETVPPKVLMPTTFMPTEITKVFSWRSDLNIINTGIADFVVTEFKINSLYDPEAALGGTQPSGFNTLMQIYNFFQVDAVKVNIQVSNRETDVELYVGWILRDRQPTLDIPNRQSAINTMDVGPRVGIKQLGFATGQNRATLFQPKTQLSSVVGQPHMYKGDLGYSGAANADPGQLIWGAIILYSEGTAIYMPNGLSFIINIEFTARLFSLRSEIT